MPMERVLIEDLKEEYRRLSSDGFRVLAVAYRDWIASLPIPRPTNAIWSCAAYVAFFDPPKDTTAPAVVALGQHGVAVKVLTGDNELVSKKICHEVGIPTEHVLLGSQIEAMSDTELAAVVEETTLFARLAPTHKQRIIAALQSKKHVVGFLGDGINDAPALRTADVGISVDSRGRHCQGVGRPRAPGKEPSGAGRRHPGRSQGLRQHPQVHPHGRQFQLRQHVQCGGRQRFSALRAHVTHPDPEQQPALRFHRCPSPPTMWTRNRSRGRVLGR